MKNFSLVIFGIIITAMILELCLRLVGHGPFEYFKNNSPDPTIYKPDKKLGWTSKTGSYHFKTNKENIIKYKFLKDGSRYTGYNLTQNSIKKIVLIGGSFAMGHGVNDEETFAYLLQKKLNRYQIKNFGIGGYGTYQSYLKLKDVFDTNKNIKIVVYSFIEDHEDRNVGDVSWHEFLTRLSGAAVYLPYAKLDKFGGLLDYPPEKYIVLPLSNFSVLITKIQKTIMKIIRFSLNKDRTLITKKIITKMSRLSKKNNSNFIFVNLLANELKVNDYKKFAKENHIPFSNCHIELNQEYVVKNDTHPNNLAHKKYFECILNLINEQNK
jgi:hypothetical protein